MKRFLPWLLPILLLLGMVPILMAWGSVTAAKICGVLAAVLTSAAVRVWLIRSGKVKTRPSNVRFTINERYILNEHSPYYRKLAGSNKKKLEERMSILLAELSFDYYDRTKTAIDKEDCLVFALALVLTVDDIHRDCKKKIVVFWDEAHSSIENKGGQLILFINLAVLSTALQSVNSSRLASLLPVEIAENLNLFYSA